MYRKCEIVLMDFEKIDTRFGKQHESVRKLKACREHLNKLKVSRVVHLNCPGMIPKMSRKSTDYLCISKSPVVFSKLTPGFQ